MRTCAFEGCGKAAKAVGYCTGHYRQSKAGEVLRPLQKQVHGLSEEQRFLALADVKSAKECWEWKSSRRPDNYGQWRRSSGQIELAHRAAWRLFRTEIPKGAFILHRCDNPPCVNPAHLFLGSQTDNMRDMWNKGRARPGQSKGEAHGMSKLTAEAVRDIRTSPESGVVLSKKYGISQTTVSDVRKRRIWKHID